MPDIAALGLSVATDGLDTASQKLDTLASKAASTEKATDRFSKTFSDANATIKALGQAAQSLSAASDKLTASLTNGAGAATRAAAATANDTSASRAATVAKADLARATDAATAAEARSIQIITASAVARRSAAESDAARQALALGAAGGDLSKAGAAGSIAAATAGAASAIEADTVRSVSAFERLKAGAGGAFTAISNGLYNVTGLIAGKGVLGAGGAAAVENDAAAIEKVGHSAGVNSTALREFLVVGREGARGDFTRMAGSVSILANALGLLPVVLGVAAAGFATLAIARNSFNDDASKAQLEAYAGSLGLTEKEMRKLSDTTMDAKGSIKEINLEQVTFGDTAKGIWKAFIDVPGVQASGSALKAYFSQFLSDIITLVGSAGAFIYAAFVGTYNAVKNQWQELPGLFKYILAQTISGAVSDLGFLANKAIDAANLVNGITGAGKLNHVDWSWTAPKGNDGAGAANDIASSYTKAYAVAMGAEQKFAATAKADTIQAAKDRIKAEADAIKGNRSVRAPGATSTALDGFDKIQNAGDNDISKLQAQGAAYQLTAVQAATLEEKTKLLNMASSQGLTLTTAQIAAIDKLAATYGALKVAADQAKAVFDINAESTKATDALKQQAATIGLVGYNLAYASQMQKQLNEYAEKTHNAPVTAAAQSGFAANAGAYASQSAANDNAKYVDQATKGFNSQIDALQVQQTTIGKSAAATDALTYAQKLNNDNVTQGLGLTSQQMLGLEALQAQQFKLTQGVAQTKDAYDFLTSAGTGFVSDLQSNLKQGEGFFTAFTNAVSGLLDKIVNKLEDVAINAAFGDKSGGGVGGFLGAIGKALGIGGSGLGSGTPDTGLGSDTAAFGAPDGFAKGAAFGGNGIISSPTLFRFAKGTALGEMGEAGPEAIMPLKRGANGSLGVQMHGGGGKGVAIQMGDVHNNYTISGAIDQTAITQSIQQTAEQTKQDLRKSIGGLIHEYTTNGAVAQ